MREVTPTLDTVVCEAVEIPDPAERAAYLARACGADPALRERAEALVAAHFRAGNSFLEPPLASDSTVAFVPDPGETRTPVVGAAVGPYKLLEQIGEGGMGLVFVAEQTTPVRRKVALKVIKPGMDSRQVVARFEQERQALALMDHPHIARVLDAGTTAGGLPYFAMELVRGLPLTQFCDGTRLPLADRLRLFAQVCRAVQHAHHKGVIHRDLKPSNVLVGEVDGRPVPKVIDFGIAKATAGPLTDRTLHTGHHQFVGTPQYMSPEQAAVSGVDVDTRSDVYSLGVLLYELVTGGTPVEPVAVRTRGLDEVRRMVREDEPAAPSKRLSTLDARHAATVADARRADPQRLARQVRGELDWVVMAALEKDRGRRYQSPADLAADVERHLAEEPVQAAPPSVGYRLRKFARRNRAAIVTLGLVAFALIAGTAVSVWQAVEATRARRDADDRLQNELRAKAEAAESYRRARGAVKQMLTRVATDEVGAIPQMKDVRRKLLEDAAGFYTELLKLDPNDAEGHYERGKVYRLLARDDDAVPDFEKAIALDPGHVGAHFALGRLWGDWHVGKRDRRKAVAHFTRAIELVEAGRVGDDRQCERDRLHFWICAMHGELDNHDECRRWLRAWLALAPPTAETASRAAYIHFRIGEPERALEYSRRGVELAPTDSDGLRIHSLCLGANGDREGALAAINEAIRVNPWPHSYQAAEQHRIRASYYAAAGDEERALADFHHSEALYPLEPHNYEERAVIYLRRGDHPKALADYNRLVEHYPRAAHVYKRRATCHFRMGNHAAAMADVAWAVELAPEDTSIIPWIGPDVIAACPDAGFRQKMLDQATRVIELTKGSPSAYSARASLYAAMKMDAKARDDWEAAIAVWTGRVAELAGKPGHDEARKGLADVQAMRGHSLLEAKSFADAEPILRECLATRAELLPDSWLRFNSMSMLGGALLGQKRYTEAEPLLIQGYEGMQKRKAELPAHNPRLTESVDRLVELYEATHQPEKAKEWRAKKPASPPPPERPR